MLKNIAKRWLRGKLTMAEPLYIGIDVGTSGVRTAVVNRTGEPLSFARAQHHRQTGDGIDASLWWSAVEDCLLAQMEAMTSTDLDAADVRAIAVDGTSGSMVLIDEAGTPVTPALMYDSKGFDKEAERISNYAPDGHITLGNSSALGRVLRLQTYDVHGQARWIAHQADYIAGCLRGEFGVSDYNNALKTGFDPEAQTWPAWFAHTGLRTELLPGVAAPGDEIGGVSSSVASKFGLPTGTKVHAGTTDSIAAFLATDASEVGDAVVSLGSTLAIKMLSDVRVDDPARGIYSHRLAGRAGAAMWLVGGASNTGGAVLADLFTTEQIVALSADIDPSVDSGLAYYPLRKAGERFPVSDSSKRPVLTPRPDDDAHFLHGLLESMARIERQCFDALKTLGAPEPKRVLTAGGGAQNPAWTALRKRIVSPNVQAAAEAEAAIGAARLCLPR
ncbi:MAG: FGGY-family carbohydrate kinase [Pseudomonadota bacterium]